MSAEFSSVVGGLCKVDGNDSAYYIQGENSSYNITFYEGSISISLINGDNGEYSGEYIQVSNAGANMSAKSMWLNIPQINGDADASSIKVSLNGQFLEFDQPPVIENDRTLVPMRAIFEALGAAVNWNDEAKSVSASFGDTSIILTIGSDVMYKNDDALVLDVPAKIIGDRTMVPLRAVSEAFGINVDWNGANRTVTLTFAS